MTEPPTPQLRQCVILAGGMGTRLGARTTTVPKPILPVGDRPFLAWLLRELQRYGFTEALLLCGHLGQALQSGMDGITARLPKPMRIVFSHEATPLGTAGALVNARALLDDRFLLCNGDSLTDGSLAPLLAQAAADRPEVLGRLLLHDVPDVARYGTIATEGDEITAFRPAGEAAGPGAISAGIGVFMRGIVDHLPPAGSLEHDVLPGLAASGRLRATSGTGMFIDIGTPPDLRRAQTQIPSRLRRPALVLDRDGVINVDHGYVGDIGRFEFTPSARAAVALAGAAGWHVFIASNQSGIARGLYTEAAVARLHAWLQDRMLAAGGTIDDIRICPTHPDATVAAYARASDWRKPGPGMLLDLVRAWELDPARCIMVGDQQTDMAAAAAAGMRGHLFPGGDLAAFVSPLVAGPAA